MSWRSIATVRTRMPLSRVLSLLLVLALGVTASTSTAAAQAPPATKSECLERLKDVDKDIVWLKGRYDKQRAKKQNRIDDLDTRVKKLKASQSRVQARMDEINAALQDQETPPSDEDSAAMVEEYNDELVPRFEANRQKLRTATDTREG